MSEESLTKVLGPSGQWLNALGGALGEAIIGQSHAPHYEAVKRGRVFIGANAITGVAIPIYSAKANALTLWNPAGNDFNFVLIATYVGFYSTTNVAGSLCYGFVSPAGAAAATAAPIPTATLAHPNNALVGGGWASTSLFSPAVNTTTANPTLLRPFFSLAALTAATAAAPFNIVDYIDGGIIIPPNCALQIVGSTAVAITATQALVWEEVPI